MHAIDYVRSGAHAETLPPFACGGHRLAARKCARATAHALNAPCANDSADQWELRLYSKEALDGVSHPESMVLFLLSETLNSENKTFTLLRKEMDTALDEYHGI